MEHRTDKRSLRQFARLLQRAPLDVAAQALEDLVAHNRTCERKKTLSGLAECAVKGHLGIFVDDWSGRWSRS